MKFAAAAILLTAAVLTACSGIPRRESDQKMLARYTSYAGEPVTEFRTYSAYDSWSPIDDHHVLIQTNVNEAYLITVFGPCTNLPFASHLAVTSRFPNTVSTGFDSIRVDRQTCRISEIRPVDYRQMRADMAEELGHKG